MAPKVASPWVEGGRLGVRVCGGFRNCTPAPAPKHAGDEGLSLALGSDDGGCPLKDSCGDIAFGWSEVSTACSSAALFPAGIPPVSSDLAQIFDVGSVLGAGRYGSVRAAVVRADGRRCAIKHVPEQGKDNSSVTSEVQCMRRLSHPNIVKLHEYHRSDAPEGVHHYLVLELCDRSLMDVLQLHVRACRAVDSAFDSGLDPARAEAYLGQMLSAVAYMHGRRIIHRDIKLANFLVSGDSVKLADFGFAVPIARGEVLSRRCGTKAYMAPEVSQRCYGQAADVWSLGVSGFILCTDHYPFDAEPGSEEYSRCAHQGAIAPVEGAWAPQSKDTRRLVLSMLVPRADHRPTSRELALLHGCSRRVRFEL